MRHTYGDFCSAAHQRATAVELGRAMGARVIACAGSREKLAIAQQHGADHLIDYSKEEIRERVKAITGGRGADVIYGSCGR